MASVGNEEFKRMRELLNDKGYSLTRIRGSHFIYSNGLNTVSVNRNLNKMVARRLVRENNLGI